MKFYAQHINVGYTNHLIVEDFSFDVPQGKIISLIGGNGSGKSTILKTMSRILSPEQGSILLDGQSIHAMHGKELAKKLSILPQNPESPEGLTVEELVAYGRSPYKSGFGRLTNEDKRVIAWALEVTQMSEFAQRPLENLSGGQRQRAWIAMCIAQDTDIVFLDEPTTFLDVSYQLDIMKLLRELNRKYHKTIIMVVHDLNHASLFSDYIVAIKKGKIIAQGTPKEVITEENCKDIFGVLIDVWEDKRTGNPICITYDSMQKV